MLSAGIVGLPNVGKSTLFNAVTRTQKAQAANYPFCTIDPNVGVVTVPDPRLAALSKLSHSKKIVPAAIEFVDIAGLVKGASSGEGLGNQFLSVIREVNAIVQVVRCFEDPDIHHVSGSVDPVRDIEIINTELILADLAAVQKRSDRQTKAARVGDKLAKAELALCEKLIPHLDAGKPATTLTLSDDEQKLLREFFLLSGKATIFACNVAEADLANVVAIVEAGRDNEGVPPSDNVEITAAARYVQAVQDYARSHFATEAVVISAQIESELVDLSEEEAAEYLRGIGVASSGVGSLIRAVYHLLGLRTYLTTGEQETRAWTIRAGDKAPAAAGVIHSDFERGFIAAETVHFDDLIRLGSQAKAREAGKLRIEGKEYVVQDGDVVEFRFNV
ncbi:MAG: ribosome-binding ATPase [Chthoniobacter sp.]|jgi:ribosome-binding ATPase YchF (GTP1/OBG family)|nr:ribosome-binding ATPase [Chthoniobacter sp.]